MWCLISDNTWRHHVQVTSWTSHLIGQIWHCFRAKEVPDIIQDSCLRDIIWHSEKRRFVFWMLCFLHKNSKSLLTSLNNVSWKTVTEQNQIFKAVLFFVFSRSSKWSKINNKRAFHPLSFSDIRKYLQANTFPCFLRWEKQRKELVEKKRESSLSP